MAAEVLQVLAFPLGHGGGGWLAYEYSLPLELSDEDEDLRTLNAL